MAPEIDDIRPGHLLIAVQADPFILLISYASKFSFERSAHEAQVVIGRGIDQMAEFFFFRPCSRSGFDGRLRFGDLPEAACAPAGPTKTTIGTLPLLKRELDGLA